MNHQLFAFFIVSLFLVISPGPNMALIIDNATRLGKKNAIVNVLGLCTATYFQGAFSIFGISAIVLNNKYMFIIVKVIGAIYLLYMGFKAITAGLQGIKSKELELEPIGKEKSIVKLKTSYVDGFITQILNPKVSIFYIAAFPKFLSSGDTIGQGFELVGIHTFNIFMWFTLMTIFISFSIKSLRKPKVKGYINLSTGVALSLFAMFILLG